ncbi:hypothetical protein llap_7656 [Limosa lapponica baueri]|uniref:Uncharacterized protein n=1 Tax=Limosa lapponica baueri TaxID=1758121 RepID=A0A2I0U7G9_LIMLA|nr:hypothetical protein llap_7656 [Limosa lapponica baueri]
MFSPCVPGWCSACCCSCARCKILSQTIKPQSTAAAVLPFSLTECSLHHPLQEQVCHTNLSAMESPNTVDHTSALWTIHQHRTAPPCTSPRCSRGQVQLVAATTPALTSAHPLTALQDCQDTASWKNHSGKAV